MFDNQVATVCMPGKFAALCRKLTKDQRDIVEKIGLGKLLNIPSMPIQRMLVESLVEKFNAADRTFTIQGHVVSISPWDVYCILGLVDKGEKIEISRKQADRKWFSVYKQKGDTAIILPCWAAGLRSSTRRRRPLGRCRAGAGALRTRRPWMSRLAAAPHPSVLPPLWAAALLKLGSLEADRRSRTLGLGRWAEDGGPEAEAHWLGLAVWGADGGGREGGGQTGKDRRGARRLGLGWERFLILAFFCWAFC